MTRILFTLAVIFAFLPASAAVVAASEEVRGEHVLVHYDGIGDEYAKAVARLVDAAWEVYDAEFGFDLPERVIVSATADHQHKLRLWTDGEDRITLTLNRADQLKKPSSSGVFNVYGLCHELGHITMYRTLKERSWLRGAAAEGWAHYTGSWVVDQVFEVEGESLWPDRYDYRADGMRRLEKQLRSDKPSPVARAAGQWRDLADIVGRQSLPGILASWNDAEVKPSAPADGLRTALMESVDQEHRKPLASWFDAFAEESLLTIESSTQSSQTIAKSKLSGSPAVLRFDDGESDGKRSIAGGGHAVFFDAPPGDWYLVGIKIYGSRYGHPRPPKEKVAITLCDEDLKPIKSWKRPYATFKRGQPRWHSIPSIPAKVPEKFAICFDFAPTATKGVFVHVDKSSEGHSVTGLPGRRYRPLDGADWMIRVELDTPQEGDALR